MFKFKDNVKAAGSIFSASGAVTALVGAAFFASAAWLLAIAAALIVCGFSLSLYSNTEFEEGKTPNHALQNNRATDPNVPVRTAVDCSNSTNAVDNNHHQAHIAA